MVPTNSSKHGHQGQGGSLRQPEHEATHSDELTLANKGVVFEVRGAVVTQEEEEQKKEQNPIGQAVF